MQTQGQGRSPLAFLLPGLPARLRGWWRRRAWAEPTIDLAYAAWARRDRPDAAAWRARIAALSCRPLLSVVMPVHETEPAWLAEAVGSVLGQFYDNWELLIADDASGSEAVGAYLDRLAGDHRISVQRLAARGGIAAASNAALSHATGEYVLFLDHDDVLAPHALAAIAEVVAAAPELELVFSDEDQLREGRRASPYFKPGWNPDLLLEQNCINHLAAWRRDVVGGLGGMRGAYDGSQDYDFALRATADMPARKVRHIPMVLYHWRQSAGAASAASAEACRDAAWRAVRDYLGAEARVAANEAAPRWLAVRFSLTRPAPKVSLIGATPALVAATEYDPARLELAGSAAAATGEVLVFLAAGMLPVSADWLLVLVAQAMRPEIGAAGARLEAADGSVLHAGFMLDRAEIARSPMGAVGDPGYRGQFCLSRSVAAVTMDALAVRRAVFEAAGGFTGAAGDFADVDLCLRLAARGLRSVWTPHARLRYGAAPAPKRAGKVWMQGRWAAALAADPYGNLNLELVRGRVTLRR